MIYTQAYADFKERIRKSSFLMLVGIALLASFYFVPRAGASFNTLIISSNIFIQADNPTWIPIATAIVAGVFLPIAGFALCTGSISRERASGMYFTLAAQGMKGASYIAGKFLSNFCMLGSMLGVMAAGSFIMMNVRFFLQPVSVWVFISPFLAVIPGLLFTAAAAVMLECLPLLKKAAPFCIAAFFVFHVVMLVNATSTADNFGFVFDISGYAWLQDIIFGAAGDNAAITILGGGGWISQSGTQQLIFSGLPLLFSRLLQKALLIFFSMIMLLFAAICLEIRQPTKAKGKIKATSEELPTKAIARHMPYISVPCGKGAFLTLFLCELRRSVKQLPPMWLVFEVCLFTASIFAPIRSVYTALIPVMFGAAVLPFSALGTAEHFNGMNSILISANKAYIRKTIAEIIVAVLFSVILASAAIFRGFAVLGAESGFSLLLFAVLSPLAGLVLGRACKTSRVFELLYLCLVFVMLNAPGLIIRI